MLDRAEEQVVEPMHKVSRASTAMVEAIEDGIHAVKRVGKTSSDAAEQFIDDTKDRIKRHPAGTVAAAFAIGFIAGGLIDWLIRRK
jgi:ElaB/YqjD/DUF883 family membrane-anchored ribosome-binding protein